MVALVNGEFELAGMAFGTLRSSYPLLPGGFSVESAQFRIQDTANPNGDGRNYGRDYLEGVTYVWEMYAFNEDTDWREASRLASAFRKIWHGGSTRKTPRAVDVLRAWHGDKIGLIYGRARNYVEDRTQITKGILKITCDFAAANDLVYEDVLNNHPMALVTPSQGGLVAPLVAPLTGSGTSTSRQGVFTVGGDVSTAMMVRLNGPITNPRITVVGEWTVGLDLVLAADQYVDVDARLWARTVMRNKYTSVGGKLTRDTPALEDLVLSPGTYEMVFTGVDPTATATANVSWRNARSSI